MKKHSAILSVIIAGIVAVTSFSLFGCTEKENYPLTVKGSELLFERLEDGYAAGEEVAVKIKIKPYEGVKVTLDAEPLVKVKSSPNEYWQFTFEMPSHGATLDITSYKGFDEPLLYGFYLTFNDKNGDSIEAFNKPIDDEKAVADYAVIYYEDNYKVISHNEGANVFTDRKSSVGTNSYEQESTLNYTYELLDAIVTVTWVYIDETTQRIYAYGGETGYRLDDLGGALSLSTTQNLSDNRYTRQMEEYEEKFDSFVKVNFVYLDYLTRVKVLEYSADNELIGSTAIEKSESEITHTVGGNCEYVVIEEAYASKDGNTHCERTLINKNDSEFGVGKMLKYPRGDGLISPVYLSVRWTE